MYIQGGFGAGTSGLVGLASGWLLGQQGRSCAHPTWHQLGVQTLPSLIGEPSQTSASIPFLQKPHFSTRERVGVQGSCRGCAAGADF